MVTINSDITGSNKYSRSDFYHVGELSGTHDGRRVSYDTRMAMQRELDSARTQVYYMQYYVCHISTLFCKVFMFYCLAINVSYVLRNDKWTNYDANLQQVVRKLLCIAQKSADCKMSFDRAGNQLTHESRNFSYTCLLDLQFVTFFLIYSATYSCYGRERLNAALDSQQDLIGKNAHKHKLLVDLQAQVSSLREELSDKNVCLFLCSTSFHRIGNIAYQITYQNIFKKIKMLYI